MSHIKKYSRAAYAVAACLFSLGMLLPMLASKVSAAQVANRSIQLSNSSPTAANTIYKVGFTVSNVATNIGGIAIDFCSNSPIVGDTCTPPTGFDTVKATLTVANQTNITGLSVDAASTTNKLILAKTAGAPSGAALTFELGNGFTTGLTNPTPVSTSSNQGTFYARIYTYTTTAAAQTHSTTAPAGYTDFGGVAMSTASQVLVTAKVQETLTFCIYTGANCSAGGTAITLGDTNGILSTAGPFVDKKTKFDIASNASNGVAIKFKGPLPTSGANTLTSIGATGTGSTAGTSQFGFCAYRVTGAILSIIAPYNNGAADGGAACLGTSQTATTGSTGGNNGALFAYDTTPAATTYGDDVASATAGSGTAQIAFIGNLSGTQPAGVYATSLSFIATPTY